MAIESVEQLRTKKCVPCEGGVPPVSRQEAERLLKDLPGWTLSEDGIRIRREWVVKNFMAAMDFFQRVAALAEEEGHHPDLHLVGYRNVAVELWTHAIGGLSENDFIEAAKIDLLPIALKGK
jgi:4a-hydroxytetrahydrobiopterin dehydratase